MTSIRSSQLSIIISLEEFNERIFQVKSEFYNLEEVDRLEAEVDHHEQAVSIVAASNPLLTLPHSDSLFSFIEA
jgi:hypothetical protein